MVVGALLLASFAVMLAGALVFTNAVEWLGVRLDLGYGAVGSVLAAVATALPESLIPVVAIVGGTQADEIAIGAIIGAPFLLATLAMAVSGGAALLLTAYALVTWKTITQGRQEGGRSRAGQVVLQHRQVRPTEYVPGSRADCRQPGLAAGFCAALVAFGMIFTSWRLTTPALLAIVTALAGAGLSLTMVRRHGGWPVPLIGCWAGLYAAGIASITATA